VLFSLLVTGAIDEGLHTYDLGYGDHAYKFQFATEVRETCTMGLYPRDVLEAQWGAERPTP
jgi:CelD/BcsL family acetyltransferase involved in cellulose biosynthesis